MLTVLVLIGFVTLAAAYDLLADDPDCAVPRDVARRVVPFMVFLGLLFIGTAVVLYGAAAPCG